MKQALQQTAGGERLPLVDAARYIGSDLSPHTLRSWAKQRKVSYIRAGRRLYFAKVDLDVFIRASRVEANR